MSINGNVAVPSQLSEEQLRELFLDYEIRASGWASMLGNAFLQKLAGRYFRWKLNRKYKRWRQSRLWAAVIEAGKVRHVRNN